MAYCICGDEMVFGIYRRLKCIWLKNGVYKNTLACMLKLAAVSRVCLVQFHSGVHNFAGDFAMFSNDDKNLNR